MARAPHFTLWQRHLVRCVFADVIRSETKPLSVRMACLQRARRVVNSDSRTQTSWPEEAEEAASRFLVEQTERRRTQAEWAGGS